MFRSIELFAGTGGLALGLQSAGFSHEALYEWDSNSCDNLYANIYAGYPGINQWRIFRQDVREVDFSIFSGIVAIAGGPPCQPFSLGGKHGAYNDARDMWPQAVRAVREIQPKAFIFENVRGLARKSFASYFSYIILQLQHPSVTIKENEDWTEHLRRLEEYHTSSGDKGLEYNVVFRCVNAADYGVPQQRHRVIIVGFRSDLDACWSFPVVTHSKAALDYAKYVSGSYWEEKEIPSALRETISSAALERVIKTAAEENTLERWKTVRDVISGLPSDILNNEPRLGAKVYAGHTGSKLDEPSKTIKAGTHGVPGGENMVVHDDGSVRYYTVREAARIQTFPDNYRFSSSWTESMRQIGNAVPVKLAFMIGSSVVKKLEAIIYG